jgi:hypothetical protein
MISTHPTPARIPGPPPDAFQAALRAVSGVLLLILAGCEFETSAGWDKEHGTNETESVKAEMKMEGP